MLFITLFLHQTTTSSPPASASVVLFITLFLHQTTTACWRITGEASLFITLFLHQTTTVCAFCCLTQRLFITLFLHQTTTLFMGNRSTLRCLSLYSYIKPQPLGGTWDKMCCCLSLYSYIKPQLPVPSSRKASELFITLFLHQTTTLVLLLSFTMSCLSLYSYIKPQRNNSVLHNNKCCLSLYSYIKPQPPPF